MLFPLIFICNGSIAFGDENMETVYYYIVQPGDNLWNISKELYGTGTKWNWLYNDNQHIFDSSLIYPSMKLEILSYGYPEDADERFITETRKKTKLYWLAPSYVHYYQETPERHEYPKETEKEKEYYKTKDSEDILYSYETEVGLYLTEEEHIRIWVMTKEINGEVIGIAGEYRGSTYIGGNFYYEKQKDGTVKEAYQLYINGGTGRYDPSGGVYDYPY